MTSLQRFLLEPHPFEFRTVKEFISSFFVGLFIATFLFVFKPFGFDSWDSGHQFFHLAVFGSLSWLVPFFLMFSLKKGFPFLEKKWNVWKEIVSMLFFILAIATCCYCYLTLIGATTPSISSFLMVMLSVLLIAFFPATANVYTMHKNLLAEHLKKASEMNQILLKKSAADSKSTLTILAENGKDTFRFEVDSILYIQAASNYVEVISIADHKLRKTLIRTSLKCIEEELPADLVRCHRSAIVNLKQIQTITGNAQGYKISFSGSTESVLVSRKYASEILHQLKK